MASIYGLIHPETGELRYIGKADSPAKRLASHLRDSRRRNTPVYAWIRKLLANRLEPDMVVLAESDDWEQAERSLIHRARALGHNLLNVAEGGNQPECPRHVRAANGRKSAARRNEVVFRLLQRLGQAIRYARKAEQHGRIEKMSQAQSVLRALSLEGRERFAAEWNRRGNAHLL